MVEAYTVAARLEMTTNAGQVTAQVMAEFGRLNREIKSAQGNMALFTAELRTLSSGGRGINALLASMEKLTKARLGTGVIGDLEKVGTATRELQIVQAELARSTSETAVAYREMATAARAVPRGVGAARGSNGAAAPGGAARASGAAAGGGFHDDYALAMRENAGRDRTRAAVQRAAHQGYRDDYALAMRENADRNAAQSRREAASGQMLNTAMGAQMAGDAGWSFFEKSIMAEAEVRTQLASLRMNNRVTDADIAKARTAAETIARTTPGTTIADNLHKIVDLFTVMGDVNEALAGAPAFAQAAYVIKNLPGAHHGDESFAAAQAVEVMQRFYDRKTNQVDVGAFNQQMAAMVQVAAGTGGRVEGNAYLGFAKQARVGGMVANDQFLYRDLPAMLISMGGTRSGTGDAATFQQFITGRMTEHAADMLKRIGLLDKTATWKGGMVADMQKHMPGFQEFGTNPVQFVRDYMLDPQHGALARNKVNPSDLLGVAKFLSDFSSKQTGLGFMAEMTLGMGGIDKERGKIGDTTRNPLQVMQQNDPLQQMREFRAVENELMVTLGAGAIGPAMEALKGLTNVVRDLSDWGKSHPNAAADFTLVVGGLSALASAVGTAATVVFVGAPLVQGLVALGGGARALAGGLGPFAAGGAAAGALGTLPGLLLGFGAAAVALPPLLNAAMKALGGINEQATKGMGKGLQVPGQHIPELFGPPAPSAMDRFMNGPPATGHGGGRGSQHSSLMTGPGSQPIHATVINYMDGREIGRHTAKVWGDEMSGPSRGTTGFDARETPVYPGAATVAI